MEDLYRSDGKPKRRIARLARQAVKGRAAAAAARSPTLFEAGRGYL